MSCGQNSSRIPRVYSVSNLDGTLTISPTTGDVVASLEASLYADILAAVAGIHNPVSLGTPNGLSLAAGQVLSLGLATDSVAGALSAADWSTFNAKQDALTFGNLTVGSNLSVSGGTGAVIGAGASISLGTSVVTAITNDTNVTGSITSNTLTLGWTGTLADARIASAAAWNAKESALTFNSPLSRSVNAISLGVVPLSLGGANAALTAAAGGLIYSTTTALAVQAAGTAGYFARSGGTGTPTWFNLFGTANTWTAAQTVSEQGSVFGGSGAAPSSVVLDLQGTEGAFMLPRLTTPQRDALTGAAGMLVYNTTTANFNFYNDVWRGFRAPVFSLIDIQLSASQTVYIGPGGTRTVSFEGVVQMIPPYAGRVRNLRVVITQSQPASGSLVFTVRVDGTPGTVIVTIPAGGGAGAYVDTTHADSFTVTQNIAIQIHNNATALSARIRGITFEYEAI